MPLAPRSVVQSLIYLLSILVFSSCLYTARLEEDATAKRGDNVLYYPSNFYEALQVVPMTIYQHFDVYLLADLVRKTDPFDARVLFFGLWTLYFAKRILDLFFHFRRSSVSSQINLYDTFGESLYLLVFSVLIGYSLSFNLSFPDVSFNFSSFALNTAQPWFYPVGFWLFMIGIIGNSYIHYEIKQQSEQQNHSSVAFLQGNMFNLVTCPQYSFELLTWIGYSILTHLHPIVLTYTAIIFVLILTNAQKRQRLYRRCFHGQRGVPIYPADKALIIPYVL